MNCTVTVRHRDFFFLFPWAYLETTQAFSIHHSLCEEHPFFMKWGNTLQDAWSTSINSCKDPHVQLGEHHTVGTKVAISKATVYGCRNAFEGLWIFKMTGHINKRHCCLTKYATEHTTCIPISYQHHDN